MRDTSSRATTRSLDLPAWRRRRSSGRWPWPKRPECPAYIVHISTGRGAAAVAGARSRGQDVLGETCPQYLLLTDAEFDRPGFEGAKFICSPPLRKAEDNAALWNYLAAADLQTVGTDHCPFFFVGEKDLGRKDGAYPPFTRIPGGMPGIESRLSLLYTFGVGAGRLTSGALGRGLLHRAGAGLWPVRAQRRAGGRR